MGGRTAQRGFIFQTIIAMIESLERSDWDEIKLEPKIKLEPMTELDKVDIQLYWCGKKLSAIQVKSSQNEFKRSDVKSWLEGIRKDAKDAKEICLCLVGDNFAPACMEYIKQEPDIKTVSFEHIEAVCTKKLKDYILNRGLGTETSVMDMDIEEDLLFAMLHKNSIKNRRVSRGEFEQVFEKTILRHGSSRNATDRIPRCLTAIPVINREVGLVGRDETMKDVRTALDRGSLTALVSGLGGIGKTALMQWICNIVKDEGHYVAWIDCGESLKDDLLVLGDALGIKGEDSDQTFHSIVNALKTRLEGDLYLFMDNLSRKTDRDELSVLNSLKAHIMITSRTANPAFPMIELDVLEEDEAVAMFFRYYNGDKERSCEEAVRHIVRTVKRHTLLVELLAKAAWKRGGSLDEFDKELEENGFFDVFKRKITTQHDENATIEESVMKLYEISRLSEEQQRIMKLFSIFTPEKEIYYKVGEWADLDLDALDELVELAWLGRGGLENGYHIHQIIKDSVIRQLEVSNERLALDEYGELIDRTTDTDDYLSGKINYLLVRERIVLAEDVANHLGKGDEVIRSTVQSEDVLFEEMKVQLNQAATLFNNIGLVYEEQGDYGKALEYYEKALAISEKVLGTDHPSTATTYNNIGGVYRAQGDYGKAYEYYEKAFEVVYEKLGENHPYTQDAYLSLMRMKLCLELGVNEEELGKR